MPAKSKKQYNFMQGVAHGGIKPPASLSPKKAKEFVDETPTNKRKAFSKRLRKG